MLLLQTAAWLLFFLLVPSLWTLAATGSARHAWYAFKQCMLVWAIIGIPSIVYLVTLGLSKIIP